MKTKLLEVEIEGRCYALHAQARIIVMCALEPLDVRPDSGPFGPYSTIRGVAILNPSDEFDFGRGIVAAVRGMASRFKNRSFMRALVPRILVEAKGRHDEVRKGLKEQV